MINKTLQANPKAISSLPTRSRNTDKGWRKASVIKTIGCSTILHASTKLKRTSALMPDEQQGTITRHRATNVFAPSRLAASRMESGTDAIICHIKNRPKAEKIPGKIRDALVLSNPSARITM